MNPQYVSKGPLPRPPIALHRKLYFFVYSIANHYLIRALFFFQDIFKPAPLSQRPTFTKIYPENPHLTHRVFYPPNYRPGLDNLPLFLVIHGGAFILCLPSMDDEVNAPFAARENCLVISLDYSKSPFVRYPVAVRELTSTIASILGDISLSFDRSRVAIGGYSAGGNLSLAVAQAKVLKGKIQGVAAFYPVVDFTTDIPFKSTTRPYLNDGDLDMLSGMGQVINWAYLEEGQNLRDPMLSPIFAQREDLPEWLCIVGAEYDCLCYEAGVMAARMAGFKGTEANVGGDEAIVEWWNTAGEERHGFEAHGGREKWIFVKNLHHGFTHKMNAEKTKEKEEERRIKTDITFKAVGDWLSRGAFAR